MKIVRAKLREGDNVLGSLVICQVRDWKMENESCKVIEEWVRSALESIFILFF